LAIEFGLVGHRISAKIFFVLRLVANTIAVDSQWIHSGNDLGQKCVGNGTGIESMGRVGTKMQQGSNTRLEPVWLDLTWPKGLPSDMAATIRHSGKMIYAQSNHTSRRRDPDDICRIYSLPFYTRHLPQTTWKYQRESQKHSHSSIHIDSFHSLGLHLN
jgi:hypothetical protein